MTLWADLAFALAALALGQWLAQRRPRTNAPTTVVFVPGFDRPAGTALEQEVPLEPAAAVLATGSEVTGDPDPTTEEEARSAPAAASAVVVSALAAAVAARPPRRWWPFGTRSAATAEAESLSAEVPSDEKPEVDAASSASEAPAAYEIPRTDATTAPADAGPADLRSPTDPTPSPPPVHVPHEASMQPSTAAATSSREPIAVDEDDPVLSDALGLSPERRAELAARAAAIHPTPGAAPRAEIALKETVLAAQNAVEAAQRRASAWACELSGAQRTMRLESRRKLLDFYITTAHEPESRAILERVATEDPDLAALASRALADAA